MRKFRDRNLKNSSISYCIRDPWKIKRLFIEEVHLKIFISLHFFKHYSPCNLVSSSKTQGENETLQVQTFLQKS